MPNTTTLFSNTYESIHHLFDVIMDVFGLRIKHIYSNNGIYILKLINPYEPASFIYAEVWNKNGTVQLFNITDYEDAMEF